MDTIFDLCTPRADVLTGRVKDEEFAADLAAVVNGKATEEYANPALFFMHTYPTRGLKALLESVCRRLSGAGGELNSVVRLDTQYGGGKTHSLIALVHAVRGLPGVVNADEFVDRGLLPAGKVRVAALDGENADPANGLTLEPGLVAHSIWGEMAYRLAGRDGYERVRASDEKHVAPGTDTIVELFGGEPTLILIDEVSVYLRKVAAVFPKVADQFSAFIQALIKAVTATPKAALVMTLAVSAEDREAKDAYKEEHQLALNAFAEAEAIVSRKLLLLDPTAEDETVEVLRRRLFERVDADKAKAVLREYEKVWDKNKERLCADALSPDVRDQFLKGYPLHPETMKVMTEKMSSLSTFQRTRGMLRLLARTVAVVWRTKPDDAFAIHPHHIDPSDTTIRSELLTRLAQQAYAPALSADVAAVPGKDPATAQRLDAEHHPSATPVTCYVARTVFLNTLAFGESAQGVTGDRLRYSVCSPTVEPAFVDAARKRFAADSLYLDDRPGAPMRLRVEPNLTQIIDREMRQIDPDDVRACLNAKIRELFTVKSGDFNANVFPAGPYQVDDDVGDGRPTLVVLNYDAFPLSEAPTELPQELVRMATKKGVKEEPRLFQNSLVFAVADDRLRGDMRQAVRRRLALEALQNSGKMNDLAEYQQRKVKEEYERSRTTVAIAILQCYRHLFYPSQNSVGRGEAKLGHTTIELMNAADSPGDGQQHLKRALRGQKKLLAGGDQPDAPTFVRDQTPLKTKGSLSTQDLRNEFRKAPNLSILLDDDPLIRCIQLGIDQDHFVYRENDLVWGRGDPTPSIQISANAFVHTMQHARELGLWPRPIPEDTEAETDGDEDKGRDDERDRVRDEDRDRDGDRDKRREVTTLSAEGPLKQALTELFEKARSHRVPALSSIMMKFYQPKGAWDAHMAVAVYREAQTECELSVSMDADGIRSFAVEFAGTMDKANAVKSFLDPQLRQAKDLTLSAAYTLTFATPLPVRRDQADAFVAAMTKYGASEAYVEAEAAPQTEKEAAHGDALV